jgi:hypothetical protein
LRTHKGRAPPPPDDLVAYPSRADDLVEYSGRADDLVTYLGRADDLVEYPGRADDLVEYPAQRTCSAPDDSVEYPGRVVERHLMSDDVDLRSIREWRHLLRIQWSLSKMRGQNQVG